MLKEIIAHKSRKLPHFRSSDNGNYMVTPRQELKAKRGKIEIPYSNIREVIYYILFVAATIVAILVMSHRQ